jgi:uncharacterized Zn finger protein
MAEPKCPNCACEGIEHFKSKESLERAKNGTPWFILVYCDECGHVHQTLTKHVFTTSTASPFIMPTLK